MTTADQVADNLDAAADVLLADGWMRARYRGNDGSHCILGAIAEALDLDIGKGDLAKANAEIITLERFLPLPIAQWNDTICQDGGEAQDALRRCAKALREVSS